MAKRAITDGLVKVNGEVVLQRGKKLRQGDMIEFNNEKYIIKGPPAENVSNQKEEE